MFDVDSPAVVVNRVIAVSMSAAVFTDAIPVPMITAAAMSRKSEPVRE
jgi:hypothetical protein